MIPHIGVTQEIMENIDPNDTMTPVNITKTINRTDLDRRIDSRDTYCEPQTDTETVRAIIMISHAHEAVSITEIDTTMQ